MLLLGTCSELLVHLFEIHGFTAIHDRGIVTLPDCFTGRFALQVYKSGEKTVLLEAICELSPKQTIRERLAGIGETPEQALRDAQSSFVNSVFHVWISGLLNKTNQHSQDDVWNINRERRKVVVGFPTGRGYPEIVEDSRWQKALHRAVCNLVLSREVHWVSLCCVRQPGSNVLCDALLDNEPCELLNREMLAFNWPSRDGLYSVRQFIIIRSH